jgi:hypothetical protein
MNDGDCAGFPAFPFCDLTANGGACVECTATHHELCVNTRPRCDGEARMCVACIDDGDCGDRGVCMLSGDCAAESRIIHAKVSGSTTAGCGAINVECSLPTALMEVGPGRDVIRLDEAGPYIDALIVGVDVTIDARPAILRRGNDGPILFVNNHNTVTILGGTFEGATGSSGDAIQCTNLSTLTVDGTMMTMNAESAIDSDNCSITVTRANILNNTQAGIDISDGAITVSRSMLAMNGGGGLRDGKATFVIVGNLFLGNGKSNAGFGGVNVATTKNGSRFEFNTIVGNQSQAAVAAGVQCTAMAGFMAQNNIIWNNNGPTGIEVSGGCLHDYSDIGPNPVPVVLDGMHNKNADPMFMDADTDLRPRPGSIVQRAANPEADLSGIASKDLAGKLRTAPADIGAYQVPVQ